MWMRIFYKREIFAAVSHHMVSRWCIALSNELGSQSTQGVLASENDARLDVDWLEVGGKFSTEKRVCAKFSAFDRFRDSSE